MHTYNSFEPMRMPKWNQTKCAFTYSFGSKELGGFVPVITPVCSHLTMLSKPPNKALLASPVNVSHSGRNRTAQMQT
jgi:hypothetical protein